MEESGAERCERDPLKTAVALVCAAYFLWAALYPEEWRLIDNFNLVMHEAGHLLFIPLGEFMTIAGGSLFQVVVPAVFAAYFLYHKKHFSSALLFFMVGESLLNVSVYAGDAFEMQLPLLGGDDSIHDWNWMLDRLGLLGSTREIAGAIRLAGTLAILTAAVWSLATARRQTRTEPLPF